jgi:ubiquinone/menaquinone biosynthesis C-methylase UbiE
MKKIAEKNAYEYGLKNRINCVISDATKKFPFENEKFDAVFTNGSLHEWKDPLSVFNEINRVLKQNGRFYISDLKRNLNFLIKLFLKLSIKKKSMKKGLITSIQASYLQKEIMYILVKSQLENFNISENAFGICISGFKE